MASTTELAATLKEVLGDKLQHCDVALGEVTIVVPAQNIVQVMTALRDDTALRFDQLIDLCGVDYATYGSVEWETEGATGHGFSRARSAQNDPRHRWEGGRFAVVYHLLSYVHNHRLRVRAFIPEQEPVIASVDGVWNAANWFEREAFDLYGIIFEGHPDLRRLLTDYGFIGHPFRKDFPISGHVEMRYDPDKQRVVYEPVSIEPRVLVPRVIRDDHRYVEKEGE